MANEEKSQEDLAAELLAQMASSRQSIADSVHDGGEVVGLENIHIEGTDIDFSSVRGEAARAADNDEYDMDLDDEEAEETDLAYASDVNLAAHDGEEALSRDADDDEEDFDAAAYDFDDDDMATAASDDFHDDEEPSGKKSQPHKKRKRKKPFTFTVKSAYGDAARTLMYVTITKSRKIYRWIPEPAASEAEHVAEAGE